VRDKKKGDTSDSRYPNNGGRDQFLHRYGIQIPWDVEAAEGEETRQSLRPW
jgi:hypothetical protein